MAQGWGMKFQVGIALIPFVVGTPLGALTEEVRADFARQLGLDEILSPAELGIPIQFHHSGNLSQWDEHKIFVALANPDNLGQVLEDETVPFDTFELDVGMTRAAPVVIQLAKDYMRYLEFSIRYFIFAETQSDMARQRMKSYIEALARTPAYDIRGLNRHREYFAAIPQRPKLVKLTVSYLSKLFDSEVLEYTRIYFYTAAQVSTETARKLRKALETLQAEYDFLPKEYFTKVGSTIDDAIAAAEPPK